MLLATLLFAAISFSAPKSVLITAFEPFGGRKSNGSELVAKALKSGDEVNYTVCILPVEYEKGTEAAKKCLDQMKTKPDLVLSTGEGDCTIRVETRAHNLDDTPGFPDNGGLDRKNHVIEKGGPKHEALKLPAPEMVCASGRPEKPIVRPSISPGYFVCNSTAYRMARLLNPQKIPFGFVHLPVSETCGVSPEEGAALLDKMVKEAVKVGKNPAVNPACVRKVKDEITALRLKEKQKPKAAPKAAPEKT